MKINSLRHGILNHEIIQNNIEHLELDDLPPEFQSKNRSNDTHTPSSMNNTFEKKFFSISDCTNKFQSNNWSDRLDAMQILNSFINKPGSIETPDFLRTIQSPLCMALSDSHFRVISMALKALHFILLKLSVSSLVDPIFAQIMMISVNPQFRARPAVSEQASKIITLMIDQCPDQIFSVLLQFLITPECQRNVKLKSCCIKTLTQILQLDSYHHHLKSFSKAIFYCHLFFYFSMLLHAPKKKRTLTNNIFHMSLM